MSISEPLMQSVLLGEAVEHAPVAILVADEEGRYVAANEHACELLGYARSELLSLRVPDLRPGQELPSEFAEVQAHGRHEGTTELTRKDGVVLKLRYRASETRIAGLLYYVSISWPEP
jgi:PAS domain S-box-containing protein